MAKSEFGYPTSHLTFPVCLSDWQGDNAQTTLDSVYERANAAVQDRIDWYDRKAGAYGRRARRLRYAALVFVAIGGLAPLVSAAFGDAFGTGGRSSPAAIGYIGLALAGILVMVDNFFGISASWMRYRVTQAILVRRLARFRFEWAKEVALLATASNATDVYPGLLERAKRLVDAAERIVQEETETWAERFAARVQAFDRMHRFERYDAGTGTVEVELANPTEVDLDSVSVRVNNTPAVFEPATRKARQTVDVGPVVVLLEAHAKDGSPRSGTAEGEIRADQVKVFTITATAPSS